MSEPQPSRNIEAVLGTICLVAGVALAVAVVAVRLEGLWGPGTSLIRRNPVMMVGFAVLLMLGGSRLLWQVRHICTEWRPVLPGRRFDTAVLYTKADCLLCDEAARVLESYQAWLPPIQTVDITTDADLMSRFGGCVPVVEIDGRRRFTGQVNEVLLRRLIEGATPRPAQPQVSG